MAKALAYDYGCLRGIPLFEEHREIDIVTPLLPREKIFCPHFTKKLIDG